ncbi:MAG: hypothetical protein R3F29_00895 [Planctomycetota bacterium]
MKRSEPSIPLRTVSLLPRWLMLPLTVLSGAFMLIGLAMIVYGIGWAEGGGAIGGSIGGGIGCLIGGAGGLFGTLRDWSRRLPAQAILWHVRNDQVMPGYRRMFRPALGAFAVGVVLWLCGLPAPAWAALMQTGGILAFISGSQEAMRRHTARQAHATFALYADGALDPDDRAAIDDARQKDAKFDQELREWLAISEQLRLLSNPVDDDSAGE